MGLIILILRVFKGKKKRFRKWKRKINTCNYAKNKDISGKRYFYGKQRWSLGSIREILE